jgi:hypothetical protein
MSVLANPPPTTFLPPHQDGATLARTWRPLHYVCMKRLDTANDRKVELAREILQYLIDNPNAQDTVEGITTWWLLVRTIKHQTALVKEALAMLVADGLVIAQEGSDSRTYYKLNPRRRKRIVSLLQKKS